MTIVVGSRNVPRLGRENYPEEIANWVVVNITRDDSVVTKSLSLQENDNLFTNDALQTGNLRNTLRRMDFYIWKSEENWK